jgi:hypothetical protein
MEVLIAGAVRNTYDWIRHLPYRVLYLQDLAIRTPGERRFSICSVIGRGAPGVLLMNDPRLPWRGCHNACAEFVILTGESLIDS